MTLTVPLGSGEKYQGPPPIAGIASHRIFQALLFSKPHIITMIRYEPSLLYAFPVAQSLSCCSSITFGEGFTVRTSIPSCIYILPILPIHSLPAGSFSTTDLS